MVTRIHTRTLVLVLGVVLGCKHPERTEAPLKNAGEPTEKNTWTRWQPVYQQTLTAKDRCVNAPIEHTFTAGMSPFGQRLRIDIESPRPLEMGYQILIDGKEVTSTNIKTHLYQNRTPAEAKDYCQTDTPAVAAASTDTPSEGTNSAPKAAPASKGGKGKTKESSVATKESAPAPKPTAVVELLPQKPALDTSRRPYYSSFQTTFLQVLKPTGVSCYTVKGRLGEELTSAYELIPPGAQVTVRWYRTAGTRDLEDVVFHIDLVEAVPKGPAGEYQAFLDSQREADLASLKADEAACKKSSDEYWKNPPPKNAPPPPAPKKETPPKSPEKDAIWIAGSWRWTGTEYVWDVGFWRLPEKTEATVTAKAPTPKAPTAKAPTVQEPTPKAPTAAPPALKQEEAPAPTEANVVWVPGYWVWVGDGYVWVAGQWEAPPAPEMRWQQPRYEVQLGVQVFVPGRWIKPAAPSSQNPKPAPKPKPY